MRSTLAILLVLMILGVRSASAEAESLHLTLQEALRMAMEENLDVKAELYNPAMAEAEIRKNRGIYNPRATLAIDYQDSTTQSASVFLAGAAVRKERTATFKPGVSRLLPGGGTVGLEFSNIWKRNNADPTRFMTDYWQSELALTLTQPLLKSFGREATELNISVALNDKTVSLENYRAKLSEIITQVRDEYFRLYSLREDVAAKESSLELASRILLETRKRVKAGALPAMEILNAEFGVSTREKELIDAKRALHDQMDRLRLLLQLDGRTEIAPADPPLRKPISLREEEAVARALRLRPEILAERTRLQTAELQAQVARNQTLPDLTLNANAALTGLNETYGDSLEKVESRDYPVWGIGLQFGYPLGNAAARNEAIKNRLRVKQKQAQLRKLEESVAAEVRSAIRGIEAVYKQLEVTDKGRAFAQERLTAFLKKSEAGLATIREVLEVENELTTARRNQIDALVGYNQAITQLWSKTGELLEQSRIVVNVQQADALYREEAAVR